MPGQADGSILIATDVDSEGFEKGSAELKAAIKGLTGVVNTMGVNTTKAFSQMTSLLQNIASSTSSIQAILSTTGAQAANAGQQVSAAQQQVVNSTRQATQAISQQAKASRSTGKSTQRSIADVEKDISKLGSSVNGMSEMAEAAINGDAKAVNKFDNAVEKAQGAVEGLRREIDELGETKVQTDDYSWVVSEIAKMKQSEKGLSHLINYRPNGDEPVFSQDEYEDMRQRCEQAKMRLNELIETKRILEEGGNAYISMADTELFRGYSAALDSIEAQLSGMQGRVDEAFCLPPQHVEKWNEMATLSGMIRNAFSSTFKSVKNGAAMVGMAIRHPIQAADRLLGRLASSALRSSKALAGIAKNAAEAALRRVGNAAKKAASHLAKMAATPITNMFKRIGSMASKAAGGVSSFGKSAKSTDIGLKKGFMSLLKYGLGIRSVYALIGKLRRAMVAGFQNLAQYSDETNQALSSISSALEQAKNSMATAFAPILTAIAPAVTKLINLFSTACTYIGMFFAALTGKQTFTKASAVQKDYAASLKETSDAAKDTAKSTKKANEEAERQLASFDELNILKDSSSKDDADDGASGSPADGSGVEGMFEEAPIQSGISNIAKKIRDLIKAEDWEGLGAYLASGINGALQKIYDAISWDKVGPKITYFVNAFTKTFNSLVDHLDWDLLGRTIGAGINTIVNTLNLLIEGIDWENLGSKLSVGLRGLIDEVDWKNLGNLLGNAFMVPWNMFKGFVDDMWRKDDLTKLTGWNELGIALGEGLNGIFEKIDLGKMGATLGKAITGVFQSAIDFARTFDWVGLGQNISNGINNFFQNFDAATVAKGASDVVKGILDTLITAVETTDWILVGKKTAELLANIDWNRLVDRICELAGAAFAGFSAFLGGLLEDAVLGAKEYFQGKIEECGGNVVLGILKGIKDAVVGIGRWIRDHIFAPFMEGFMKVFGIASPSKVMAEMGGYLIDGLLNGIKNIWNKVKDFFSGALTKIKDTFSKKWNDIKDTVTSASKSISDTVSEKFTGVKNTVSEKMKSAKDSISDGFQKAKDAAAAHSKSISDTVGEKFKSVADTVGKKVASARDSVKSGFNEAKNSVTTTAGNIHKTVNAKFSGIATIASNKLGNMKKSVTDGFGRAKETANRAVESMHSAVGVKFGGIASTVFSKVGSVESKVKTGFESVKGDIVGKMQSAMSSISAQGWEGVGQNICTGISNGISAGWDWLSGTVSNLATNLLDSAKYALGIHSPSRLFRDEVGFMLGLGVAEGMARSQPKILDTVSSVADTIADEMNGTKAFIPLDVSGTGGIDRALNSFADKVSGSFETLADRLNAIAKGVAFVAPAVATGNISPYAVSAEAGGEAGKMAEIMENSNEELISVIIQSINNATLAIVNAVETHSGAVINLDADSLTTTIVNEINMRTRMTGKAQILM